jgi:hypothetical protein
LRKIDIGLMVAYRFEWVCAAVHRPTPAAFAGSSPFDAFRALIGLPFSRSGSNLKGCYAIYAHAHCRRRRHSRTEPLSVPSARFRGRKSCSIAPCGRPDRTSGQAFARHR